MALILKDRVKETTTSVGTGAITLAGASTGYQAFSVIGNSNTTYYCIAGQGTGEWEVGIGTYTLSGTSLSRDTILASSNSGSVVTLSAGTKDVFVVYPAGKSVNQNASGNVEFGDGTVSAPSISFASDTNTGLYRIGADNLGVAVNGTKIIDVATTGVSVAGAIGSTGNYTITKAEPTIVFSNTGQDSWLIAAGGGGNISNGYLGFRNTTDGVTPFQIAPNAIANTAILTSTGLSVTGTLSATSTIKTGSAADASSGFAVGRRDNGSTAWTIYSAAGNLQVFDSAAVADALVYTSGSGLAVTGALSCSTNLTVTGGTITTGSTTALSLATSGGTQFVVTNTASSVNYFTVTGSALSSGAAYLSAGGADSNISAVIQSKGTSSVILQTGGGIQAIVSNTASANRYITLTGSNGGNPTIGVSAGTLNVSSSLIVQGNTTLDPDVGVGQYWGNIADGSGYGALGWGINDGSGNTAAIGFGSGFIYFATGTAASNLTVRSHISAAGLNVAGYIEGAEQTAPAAPAANGYRIFAEDNGSGKTRLMVRFASGASQQIAIEP